jgi:hypothetical protein
MIFRSVILPKDARGEDRLSRPRAVDRADASRVTNGSLCAGFEVRRGVVVACVPILRTGLASWWHLAMDPTSDVVAWVAEVA